ncbi:MAG: zf-HC2 domain-containing protein [Terracidiphilus sp.]
MAAERYLLDELSPEAREAFEDHVFSCPECALDLRAAAAFVDEAKVQFPALKPPMPAAPSSGADKPRMKRDRWLSWLRPGLMVPAFAASLLVVGYQSLVTLPALRAEVNQPRILPWTPVHGGTRGGAATAITADRAHGVAFPVDISPLPGSSAYTSYSFDLSDPQGKHVWTGAIAAPDGESQRLLLAIPAAMLSNGTYTVAVSGVGPHGERTPIDQYVFDLHLAD